MFQLLVDRDTFKTVRHRFQCDTGSLVGDMVMLPVSRPDMCNLVAAHGNVDASVFLLPRHEHP